MNLSILNWSPGFLHDGWSWSMAPVLHMRLTLLTALFIACVRKIHMGNIFHVRNIDPLDNRRLPDLLDLIPTVTVAAASAP